MISQEKDEGGKSLHMFFLKGKLAQLELLNTAPCLCPYTNLDHLKSQNYTAHSVRFSEMGQNSQKICTQEHLS